MTSILSGTAVAAATKVLSSTLAASTALSAIVLNSTTAYANSTHPPDDNQPPADNGKCHLLGPFAILVQGALGALALLSLVYKRWRERPQRPVKIWAFDVSKQVFGTVLLHMANLLMSMFSAGEIEAQLARAAAATVGATGKKGHDEDWRPNPCSFYLLNLGLDTTLGIPIVLLILKVLTAGARRIASPPESVKSGHYGEPPRVSWWLKQSVLYFFGLLGMKVCVFFIFELCPWIIVVGDWALRWTEGNTALQIAFVMLIFPLIMNMFQYYVIDTFIKQKPEVDDGASQISQGGSEGERGGLLAGDEHGDAYDRDHSHSIDEDSAYKARLRSDSTEFPDREATDGLERRHADAAESSSGSSTIAPERDIDASKVPMPKE